MTKTKIALQIFWLIILCVSMGRFLLAAPAWAIALLLIYIADRQIEKEK